MKNYYLISLTISLIISVGFKSNAQGISQDTAIYETVDVQANYPAGITDFKKYVISNLTNVPESNYKVIVHFTVDENGNIISIKPRNKAYGVEEKVAAIVKNSGNWNPAILKGKKVKSVLELTVNFGSFIENGNKVQLNSPQMEIFTIVDNDASYPGGVIAWRNFIANNLNGRIPEKKGAKPGLYTVIIQFVIERDGSVSNFQPLTNFGYGMEEEVIRVIKKSGKWNPASHQGVKLKVYRKQPVTFSVE